MKKVNRETKRANPERPAAEANEEGKEREAGQLELYVLSPSLPQIEVYAE